MADIDSSLLLFCKYVKKDMTVSLTGECADEIFGGYPWFFREDALKSNTFPWSISTNERQKLLNPYIGDKIKLKEYIDYRYDESLTEVEILDTDSKETAEKRKISHLTLKLVYANICLTVQIEWLCIMVLNLEFHFVITD